MIRGGGRETKPSARGDRDVGESDGCGSDGEDIVYFARGDVFLCGVDDFFIGL